MRNNIYKTSEMICNLIDRKRLMSYMHLKCDWKVDCFANTDFSQITNFCWPVAGQKRSVFTEKHKKKYDSEKRAENKTFANCD